MFSKGFKLIFNTTRSHQLQQNILLRQLNHQKLTNKSMKQFTNITQQTAEELATNSIKLKKKPLRFFLGLLIFNGILGFAYMKKVEYDNRYDFKILMKLLNFKKEYEKDNTKYTIEEIKQLFDEFLVENVAVNFDEKITQDLRKITKELCEKYPKEREVQLFASQVCEYEKYAVYLKQALIIDRKYIDDVLIRQMTLNCERFGKDKPFYFDEFYNTCTKYSLDNKQDEADECLSKYMSLNPPQYYRAAIQLIKNYKDANKISPMIHQIQDLFNKEKDLDDKEKEYILSFIKQFQLSEFKNNSDSILAAGLLLEKETEFSQKLVQQILQKEKHNLDALLLQAKIYQIQQKNDLYQQTIKSIHKINPSFLDNSNHNLKNSTQ